MSNYKISKTDSAPRNLQSVVFEILRTATIGFVMSVCLSVCMHKWLAGRPSVRPSVCPYGTPWLSLDGFS